MLEGEKEWDKNVIRVLFEEQDVPDILRNLFFFFLIREVVMQEFVLLRRMANTQFVVHTRFSRSTLYIIVISTFQTIRREYGI